MASGSVIQSQNDRREYKTIKLANKISCLLICDKEADKSAASLDVNIGSIYDPEDRLGLAHFLEHMLFMGTEKYPIQNDYSAYISANSGRNNAYTSLLDTNYYFDCSNSSLYGALDRFAQFFIQPLFDKSCVEREINAVDSEFQKNLMQDVRRKYQLFRKSALQGHPYTKFSTGNKATLDLPNIREDLIEFYQKYYSANLMRLVVYGKEDITTLENWVNEIFSPIKNYEFNPQKITEVPFTKENLANFWKIYPIEDKDTLEFVWILDNLDPFYKNNPAKYISHLVGHEGPNSLLSYLIDEGLALSLVSSQATELKLFSKFTISIQLTKKGLRNYKEVCRAVFQYLKIIKSKEPELRVFEEIKKMYELRFNFKDKEHPINYVSDLAKLMQYYPLEDILKLNYFMEEFQPDLIQKVLKSLTVDNMRIYLLSKSLENECDQTEKWYNTKYSVEPLSQDFYELFENPNLGPSSKSQKKLDIPPTNIFIPENLAIFAKDHDSLPQYPQKIYASRSTEVWYKQDNTFKVPKAVMIVKIYSNDFGFGFDAKSYRLAKLWIKLFHESLRETLYLAKEASLSVVLEVDSQGIEISITGFNDSIDKITVEVFTKMKEFDPLPFNEIFDNHLVRTIRDLKNFFKKPPYQQSSKFRNCLLRSGGNDHHPELELKVTEETSFDDCLEFHKKFFKNMRLDAFFIGNVTQESAVSTIETLEKIIFSIRENSKTLPKELIPEVRVVNIPPNTNWFYEHLMKPLESGEKESNSAITTIFQLDNEKPYTRMLLSVLNNYLHNPCFDTLRTNEQLGYIVTSSDLLVRGILHYIIQIQSSKKSPQFLSQRILAFIDSMKEKILAISEEEFQQYVNSVRVKIAQKDLSILQEGGRYWTQISSHKYEFDRKEVNLKELDILKREDFVKLFIELFYENRKLLEIHLVSPNHHEENKTLKDQRLSKEEASTWVESADLFKRYLPLYPDFNSQF